MTEQAKAAGACSNCGSTDGLMLAEDFTDYSPCEWNAESGKWQRQYTERQPSGNLDRVRFFCSECGTQHEVPEGLE